MDKFFEAIASNNVSATYEAVKTLKHYERYKALFMFTQHGNEETWNVTLKYVLEQSDFNPLGNNGLLVSMALNPASPEYIQKSIDVLFKPNVVVDWNLSLCVVLRNLRGRVWLKEYVERIRGCPVDKKTLCQIVENDIDYKKSVEPEHIKDAVLIAKYIGFKDY